MGGALMSSTGLGKSARWVLMAAAIVGGAAGCKGPTVGEALPPNRNTALLCQVTRTECKSEVLQGTVNCNEREPEEVSFFGTTCYDPREGRDTPNGRCAEAFCGPEGNPLATYGYPSEGCTATGTPGNPVTLPSVGTCLPVPAGGGLTLVDYQRRSRRCVENAMNIGVCDSFEEFPEQPTTDADRCFDLTVNPATTKALPSSENFDRSVNIIRVVENAAQCATGASASALTYNLPAGSLGTATGAGLVIAVPIVRGFAVVNRRCHKVCVPESIYRLRVDVGTLTVAGALLTNGVIETLAPAYLETISESEGTVVGIAAGGLRMILNGFIDGKPASYIAQNRFPVAVEATATAFRLTGTLPFLDADMAGMRLPVSVAVNVAGQPGTEQTRLCAGLNARQRLFGFEDARSWTSTNAALSLVTSPVSQGCGALGVNGSGYMPIQGAPFTTSGLAVKPALSVDLFIPGHQPNPFWLGALQAYLTCPAANAFNQYIGQVELTGKPQGRYSTLRFVLPPAIASLLDRPANTCFFSFALNVNQTGRLWMLDDLRLSH